LKAAKTLRPRVLSTGFIAPCLPSSAPQPPSGALWLHEIKHDGFRVIARKDGARVKLYSRPGNDLTHRFPLIVEALVRLRSGSCIIDGEAVACDDGGMPSFNRIRYRRHDASVFLYAFDLIELNGDDLRRDPFQVRKATLASVLAKAGPGLRFNEHIEADGPICEAAPVHHAARQRGCMAARGAGATGGQTTPAISCPPLSLGGLHNSRGRSVRASPARDAPGDPVLEGTRAAWKLRAEKRPKPRRCGRSI
jgi:ATP dependent DNA ligase domain